MAKGVKEFDKVIEVLEERKQPPKFAVSGRTLWQRNDVDLSCRIMSLSPSDAAMRLAHLDIAKLFPEPESLKCDMVPDRANHVAIVLWIEVGDVLILLGSDLQNSKDKSSGWFEIVNSNTKPIGSASLFKIPHHGSSNADFPNVWKTMLEKHPMAILTPFSRGKKLPTKADIGRLFSLF